MTTGAVGNDGTLCVKIYKTCLEKDIRHRILASLVVERGMNRRRVQIVRTFCRHLRNSKMLSTMRLTRSGIRKKKNLFKIDEVKTFCLDPVYLYSVHTRFFFFYPFSVFSLQLSS